jgi:hypothetical protein
MMSSANQYRIKATVLAAEARDERHAPIRAELLRMSQSYLRLAEQAEKNERLDICYETPPTSSKPPAHPA